MVINIWFTVFHSAIAIVIVVIYMIVMSRDSIVAIASHIVAR